MFQRLELVSTFKDAGDNEYLQFRMIDTRFVKDFTVSKATGNNWQPSWEMNHFMVMRHNNYRQLHSGICSNIYQSYKYNGYCPEIETSHALMTLFMHIPDIIRSTQFYADHAQLVERSIG